MRQSDPRSPPQAPGHTVAADRKLPNGDSREAHSVRVTKPRACHGSPSVAPGDPVTATSRLLGARGASPRLASLPFGFTAAPRPFWHSCSRPPAPGVAGTWVPRGCQGPRSSGAPGGGAVHALLPHACARIQTNKRTNKQKKTNGPSCGRGRGFPAAWTAGRASCPLCSGQGEAAH